MKIAQVAPLYESVPPHLYGGTERVVSYLTEALVEQGHEVTLFASGDSITEARLIPGCERSLRLSEDCVDPMAHHAVMLDKVIGMAEEFDIIHFHTDYAHFPSSKNMGLRNVTTLHGRLDLPDLSLSGAGVGGGAVADGSAGGAGSGTRTSRAEARAALSELGYAPDEIRGALDGLRDDVGVEEMLRLALRELASR